MLPQYKNIVFSHHARERMELRVISEDMVLQTIRRPDKTYPEADGDTKFIRRVNGANLHVVCKPVPDEDKWLVKSTWVRGEDDYGNRVDRNGRYRGKAKRTGLHRPEPTTSRLGVWLINGLMIVILITLVMLLLFVLSR